jgi:signal transduction histidine kinase/DNA-binding response OmpR family regulator
MSGDQTLVDLANNIISFLTLYVEAQVGLFYGVEKSANSPQLRVKLLASYAYTRRKNLADEFAFSEGLVERAAREQKSIRLTINTTLGEGIPPQIFLIPFLHENVIKGVIQLGSTEPLTDIQQEFLKQVIANIGIAVNSIEARTKMQELLQQTQIQAEALQNQKDELQYQKAELQQQKEELQSQTEELQSQSEELQSQTEELRHANEEMEERTKELEQQKEEGRQKNLILEKTQQAMQLKAEEVERASKYKSEFLANMSHELRTPLNSMLILAQLLAENKAGNLEDKQVEYARTIHSAGSDLLILINEILDLSKVEAGKVEVQAEDVSLMELTKSMEQKFRPIAAKKGLTFALTVAPEVPRVLNTDAQRLKQILNNLLSNAFKFTAQGEVKLTITKPGPQHFSFAVTDTGIGIPKDKQGLIFEAFQQADGSTSRRFGGTGLGLSISRQLARLLGGDIHLHSQEGQGSIFTLFLPESLPKQPENISPQMSREEEYPRLPLKEMTTSLIKDTGSPPVIDDRDHLQSADKTILVIEDDRKFSTILMELAREKGFKCLLAEDGRMGLQVAEQYQPQAIILDVGLPKLNGWNVMEKLKENSKTRHIPVHFMSAADQSQDAKQMGAIGYLLKPVSVGQLGEAFTRIEQFIAKTVKNLLVIVDNEQRQGKILELVGSEGVETTRAFTKKDALRHLHTASFDCIILDVDVEQASGIQLLEQLRGEEELFQVPVIIYAERDLTAAEEDLLKLGAGKLTVKTVKSPERLLEEATLFLHQVETQLPKEKRKMLQMMHDKESILRDKKVLIVDDDHRNTFALAVILEDKNLVVIAGENGREALELLEEHSDIDIVLMDIMMPEMDGYEAIRRIRAQPRFRKLPIIALTAKAMKGDKAKCIEAGANDYLSKPIDNDKLLSLMRVWLYQ